MGACIESQAYTQREVAAMFKLQPSRLRHWQKLGLMPRRRRYDWRDLILARRLRDYADDRRAMRRLAQAVRGALRRDPDAAALLANGFACVGLRLAVPCAGGLMDVATGQYELPFSDATPDGEREEPQAIRVQPNSETPEQWFALALALEGNAATRSQAAEAYERCLALDANFTSAYINLGTIRYHERDFETAERCYRQALSLDAGYALAYFDLGNVLDETGRVSEAIAAYAAAVRLSPRYADAHYNLALAYQRNGQSRRAVPHWRRYLGIDSRSPWADHARSQLRRSLDGDVLQLVPTSA